MQSHFSCRDVESIPFQAMYAALFGKAFALVFFCCVYLSFMFVLAETMILYVGHWESC
jgi:hypothetical protein